MSRGSRLRARIGSQRSRGGTERARSRGCVAAIVALSVAAALLVVPTPGGDPFSLLGSAPAAADSSSGPVSSSYEPVASFTALDYPVMFYSRIYNRRELLERWGPQPNFNLHWFGVVTAAERSDDLDLSFAVEGQHDPSDYQFCDHSPCDDVNVRITSSGLLYLHRQHPRQLAHTQFGYFADFPTRAVELSATDAGTALKVYREVLVGPPTPVTGCEDYGENNPDAYTCLFLREVIPDGIGGSSNEATLRASLPGLVQPAANYHLVFAEEFDGTPPAANAAGCRDGLSTLDSDVWNYRDACHRDFLDSRGEPCGNVKDGHLVVGDSGNCPGFGIATGGKLHAKYGYFEVKFSFNVGGWPRYSNYSVGLFTREEKLRYLLDLYGVETQDYEDYLTNLDIEIELFEYNTIQHSDVVQKFANPGFRIVDSDIAPTWGSKWVYYCRSNEVSLIDNPNRPCKNRDTFTVTRGLEWTPRGYRTFTKVDGILDDLTVVPKDKIAITTRPVVGNSPQDGRTLTGDAKDAYFEYLDPDDTNTLLEQVAVSHVPLPINVGVWGWLNSQDHPYVRTWMKIDYIRLWKPSNDYSDMEPVYQ